jgi:hypothetical protein
LTRQGQFVAFLLVAADGVGTLGGDHAGQDFRVAKRVSDAVGGERVLEVAGVTDQDPPSRTRRAVGSSSSA